MAFRRFTLNQFKQSFLQINSRTIYLYALLTGLATGLVAIVFHKALLLFHHIFYDVMAGISVGSTLDVEHVITHLNWHHLVLILLPALGGLISGILCDTYAPEARGSGVDEFLDSFHNRSGVMRKRTSVIKFLSSIFTLSSGGSGGREGPMVLIGSSLGSLFGKFIQMGARARRTLLVAGTAGGLGAIFRAPLGGAITAVEVLYKEDIESDALLPCVLASVTAYTVFSSVVGFGHNLRFFTKGFYAPVELFFYVILGLVCTAFAYFFTKVFTKIKPLIFDRIPVPTFLVPAIGGLCVGILGLFFPEVLGEGLSVVQKSLDGGFHQTWFVTAGFFLFLAVLKIFTTSFTVQSGGSAGTLMPSLFIGGMLGGMVGTISHHFFPSLVPEVGPYIVVGMASFFSAMTNASLGALVMVCELTGGYELLPPLMAVAVVSLVLSHKWSIFKNQVRNKFYSKAHVWDMNPALLKQTSVSQVFRAHLNSPAVVDYHITLSQLEERAHATHETDYILKDEQGLFVGVLSLKDVFDPAGEYQQAKSLLVANDLVSRRKFYVTGDQDLYTALQFLLEVDFDKVPVVEKNQDALYLKGYVQYKDLLRQYQKIET